VAPADNDVELQELSQLHFLSSTRGHQITQKEQQSHSQGHQRVLEVHGDHQVEQIQANEQHVIEQSQQMRQHEPATVAIPYQQHQDFSSLRNVEKLAPTLYDILREPSAAPYQQATVSIPLVQQIQQRAGASVAYAESHEHQQHPGLSEIQQPQLMAVNTF